MGLAFFIALSCGSGNRVQASLATKPGHTQQPGDTASEISQGLGCVCCDRNEAPSPVVQETLVGLGLPSRSHCRPLTCLLEMASGHN